MALKHKCPDCGRKCGICSQRQARKEYVLRARVGSYHRAHLVPADRVELTFEMMEQLHTYLAHYQIAMSDLERVCGVHTNRGFGQSVYRFKKYQRASVPREAWDTFTALEQPPPPPPPAPPRRRVVQRDQAAYARLRRAGLVP